MNLYRINNYPYIIFVFFFFLFAGCYEQDNNFSNDSEFRSIDGTDNNIYSYFMGAVLAQLSRITSPDYSDGISELAGSDRPSARAVSNSVNVQNIIIINELGSTDFLWQWGQFVDHDIDLTDTNEPAEQANILIPTGDPYFDPDSTGLQFIEFNRSIYDSSTGKSIFNPRQQLNQITSWIDASNVYGSDETRALELRTIDGTGRLKTSQGNLLPFNTAGLPNAGGNADTLFLAGDIRSNEQVGLTALHTLFVREHNRLAENIAQENPDYDGDQIYYNARRIVGAQMQHITFNEFLPALLGPGPLYPYQGYFPEVNANIINIFSTAAYRFGHSALSPTLLRLDSKNEEITEGNLELRDAFFNPGRITDEGGIEPLLRGLANQECQKIDIYIIDDVRNFLFGPPGAGGFDLASLNIQRGRDHGLSSYNDVREELGFRRMTSFSEISSDPEVQSRLSEAYDSVDEIDLWIGGLSEDPLPNSHLGELFSYIVKLQFELLRDGDRYWYEIYLNQQEISEIENTSLADIIRRNTNIGSELPDNVFQVNK
ncbi:MAG: peroxidase family protein [Thermodesulfobacteriota bacterium]